MRIEQDRHQTLFGASMTDSPTIAVPAVVYQTIIDPKTGKQDSSTPLSLTVPTWAGGKSTDYFVEIRRQDNSLLGEWRNDEYCVLEAPVIDVVLQHGALIFNIRRKLLIPSIRQYYSKFFFRVVYIPTGVYRDTSLFTVRSKTIFKKKVSPKRPRTKMQLKHRKVDQFLGSEHAILDTFFQDLFPDVGDFAGVEASLA